MKRLSVHNAKGVLARHDLIGSDEEVQVSVLSGGVSSTVLLCAGAKERYVLKQPMPEFATEDRWVVDTGRGRVEYAVGRFLYRHLGRRIVPLIAYDHVDDILIIAAAPRGWKTWKERMMEGEVRTATGRAAGRLLAGIHALSMDLDDPATFKEDRLFHEQRIDPYFVTAAKRVPGLKERLEGLSASFFARTDLVHGDFSPKNIFVDPAMEEVRLIDHEVATRGDAAFDLGFCLSHLLLKSIHLPHLRDPLHECAGAFLETYQDARPDEATDPLYAREGRAIQWLGACLVARAVGKSPAEYLDAAGCEEALRLGTSLLTDSPGRLHDLL